KITKTKDLFKKIKELLYSTKTMKINEKIFQMMRNKKIGQMLREMNSLEQIASQFLHYHFSGINYFEIIPFVSSITLEDINNYLNEWITEERLTSFIIEKGS